MPSSGRRRGRAEGGRPAPRNGWSAGMKIAHESPGSGQNSQEMLQGHALLFMLLRIMRDKQQGWSTTKRDSVRQVSLREFTRYPLRAVPVIQFNDE